MNWLLNIVNHVQCTMYIVHDAILTRFSLCAILPLYTKYCTPSAVVHRLHHVNQLHHVHRVNHVQQVHGVHHVNHAHHVHSPAHALMQYTTILCNNLAEQIRNEIFNSDCNRIGVG